MCNLLGHLPPCIFPFRISQFMSAYFDLIKHPVILFNKLSDLIISDIGKMLTFLSDSDSRQPFTEHCQRGSKPAADENCQTQGYDYKQKCKVNNSDYKVGDLF